MKPPGLRSYLTPLPLVAVLRGITPGEVSGVGAALVENGFRILEVPLNSPDPFDSISTLAHAFGERCLTGAGTVLRVADVARVADAGGRLIVMPHGDVAVVREAKRLGLACLPGVATATEAFAALDAGADGLKMFPAEQLSPAVLKAWRAVLPRDALVFPVGGIRPDNMAAYWAVGASGFGTGSNLYQPGASAAAVRKVAAEFAAAFAALEGSPVSDAGFDVIALGEPLIEFNQTRGSAPEYLQGFGGDTSNMAIAAARLGARAAYATRVGEDAFGRMFLDLWRTEGVDASGVARDAEAPTGIYFVTHAASGHEFSYLRAGSAASRMHPDNLPVDAIRSARILHLSGISQAISASACDASFAAIEAARSAGVKVSYDTNLRLKLWPLPRARAVILASLALADWALPSIDDAKLLFGREDPDSIIDACHASGAPLVVLRCGAAGCVVSDGRRRERIAGHRVHAVDATGAGDCFDGAFAARIVAGDDPVVAAHYANTAAAIATTGYGAVAPLPRHAEVVALLSKRPEE